MRSEGAREPLTLAPGEHTAHRTEHLLIAGRFIFVVSRAICFIAACLFLAEEEQDLAVWWAIFTPIWVGNLLTGTCFVLSWFASCPYVRLCLAEQEVRHGQNNPSLVQDLLPDILWAVFGLIFIIMDLIGEFLLCWHLAFDGKASAEEHSTANFRGPAVVFCITAILTCCRGICIVSPSSELFALVGTAALVTTILSMGIPGGLLAPNGWLLPLPSAICALVLLPVACKQLRATRHVLVREERVLRKFELLALLGVALTLSLLSINLYYATKSGDVLRKIPSVACWMGCLSGFGICLIGALRARLAFLETRLSSVTDRRLLQCLAVPILESSRSCSDAGIPAILVSLPETEGHGGSSGSGQNGPRHGGGGGASASSSAAEALPVLPLSASVGGCPSATNSITSGLCMLSTTSFPNAPPGAGTELDSLAAECGDGHHQYVHWPPAPRSAASSADWAEAPRPSGRSAPAGSGSAAASGGVAGSSESGSFLTGGSFHTAGAAAPAHTYAGSAPSSSAAAPSSHQPLLLPQTLEGGLHPPPMRSTRSGQSALSSSGSGLAMGPAAGTQNSEPEKSGSDICL